MRKKIIHSWYLFAFVAVISLFGACAEYADDIDDGRVTVPVRLSIPAFSITRAPGDPLLMSEEKPVHAYLFIAIDFNTTTTIYYRHQTLDPDKWILSEWTSTLPQSSGDAVYVYDGNFNVTLPAQRSEGRVYAIVSREPISFTEPATDTDDMVTSSFTEDDIKNLKVNFDFTDYKLLGDVYSSPAGYEYDVLGDGVKYYGTIKDISSRVPKVDLMLYHVASRVDLMWNVNVDVQSAVKLSAMRIRGLKHNDCYIFQPTMNVGDGSATHDLDVSINVGNQWYGRHCFYAIPYRVADNANSYFPVTVNLWQGTDTPATKPSGYFTHTFNISAQPVDGGGANVFGSPLLGPGSVFTPWLRGEVKITDELY